MKRQTKANILVAVETSAIITVSLYLAIRYLNAAFALLTLAVAITASFFLGSYINRTLRKGESTKGGEDHEG
jgi:hypothetical protein